MRPTDKKYMNKSELLEKLQEYRKVEVVKVGKIINFEVVDNELIVNLRAGAEVMPVSFASDLNLTVAETEAIYTNELAVHGNFLAFYPDRRVVPIDLATLVKEYSFAFDIKK